MRHILQHITQMIIVVASLAVIAASCSNDNCHGNSTGIPTAHMTAFGDDFVDVEMIDICGVGIAMENAVDDVKLHADMIIGSNDTDAISEYISRFVL